MTNIFSEFQGADLERFTACLDAIRKAGLKTTKHTQSGINQGSGNVWVWDEDWQGCVACNIQFDVAWYWSCPECGEEYDFPTYAEVEAFAEANSEGHCPSCRD